VYKSIMMKVLLVSSLCALLLAGGAPETRQAAASAQSLSAIASHSIHTVPSATDASISTTSSVLNETADRQVRFGPVHLPPGFIFPRGADGSHDIRCPGVDPCP